MGEETSALEAELRAKLKARHCFAVTNCTAALHMACAALDLRPGDEVLCPAMTFVATANASCYTGATPVFCESIGEHDLNLNAEDARRRVTERTKAIMILHYAGFPCDMKALTALAAEHRIALIEDCAHAVFSQSEGSFCGTFGEFGCYSFFSNKNMTCGEGGAIVTNRDDLADRLRLLRSHGMTTLTLERHQGHAFSYDVLLHGYNYRIDEIRSALLGVQLGKLEVALERRRALFKLYKEALRDTPIILPFSDRTDSPDWPHTAVHILPVILPRGSDRAAIMEAMKTAGIQTSIHYRPVHRMHAFERLACRLPLTEDLAARELTLPFFPNMTNADASTVVEVLLKSLH
jgi:dTDP-4-amino-4,6-dideoxygalactose transaminase